jgi:siroheme synthase-like protein
MGGRMLYPVNLVMRGRGALVVGGGRVALSKVRELRRAGARVTAVSPRFAPALSRLRGVRRLLRRYRASDLRGAAVVIAATDDPTANERVSRDCLRRSIPVNVVDRPDLCTFYAVSSFRRGPLLIAISTEGLAPGLAKTLRRELERFYPASIAPLVRGVAAARRRLRRVGASVRRLRRASAPAVVEAWRRDGLRAARSAIRRATRHA